MKILIRIGIGIVVTVVALGGFAFWFQSQIYMRIQHESWAEAQYEEPIPVDRLRADLDHMIAVMERVHPDLYAFTPQNVIGAEVERVKADIDRPMTRLEFYQIADRLNELFVDGHTWLRYPDDEWRDYRASHGRVFPISVRISDGHLLARESDSESGIRAGDELLAIGRRSGEEIVARLLSTESGERMQNRVETIEQGFARRYWYQYGASETFTIRYREAGGQVRTVARAGAETEPRAQANDDLGAGAGNEFSILEGGVGLLTVETLDVRLSPFRTYIEEAFSAFKDAGVRAVVIDIRNNGGGISNAGDIILEHLSPMIYQQTEKLDVKITGEIKEFYLNLLPEGFRWIPLGALHPLFAGIYETANGETFTYRFPEPQEREDVSPLLFDGDVYLLIGARTYSSAAMLAATIEHYDIATVIGEETGEPTVFYGDNYYFDLPSTALQVSVSHKRFYLPGGRDDGRGVRPDIPVSGARPHGGATDAMDVAMEIIRSRKNDAQ